MLSCGSVWTCHGKIRVRHDSSKYYLINSILILLL